MYQTYAQPTLIPNTRDIFVGPTGVTSSPDTTWFTWHKPKTARFVEILLIGGGAGGGGGGASAAATAAGGGGGGGGGAIARILIPAEALPDILYVQPGAGGAGGTGGVESGAPATDGATGQVSKVSIRLKSTPAASELVGISGSTTADGGNAGTTSGGSAGTGSGAAAITSGFLNTCGLQAFIAGQNGAAGQTGAGSNVSVTSTWLSGGAGGGGVNAGTTTGNGGSMTLSGDYPGRAGGTAPGGNGHSGWDFITNHNINYSMNAIGGCGGAGNTSTNTGGQGGHGGPGCGGGGGGGTNGASSVGGAGGNGGPGVIIISTW